MKLRQINYMVLSICTAMYCGFCVADSGSEGLVSLEGTATHTLYSERIQQHFLIDVFLPLGYQAKESKHQFPKYSVIYVLNSRPNAVMAAALRHVSQMSREIVVGIDYADATGQPSDSFAWYTRDLTPTNDEDWMRAKTAGGGGGAEEFLRFINNGIKPFINEQYSVNQNDQTLVGHSFGGLFGLYVLFNHPDSFERYVIASPSLWWDDAVSFRYEEQYAQSFEDLPKSVFLSVGSRELKTGPQGMVDNTKRMFETLIDRNYPNLKIKHVEFEGETHQSVVGISIQEGLRMSFQ
jgi:predicted alpha/beta superfamily hydrolase